MFKKQLRNCQLLLNLILAQRVAILLETTYRKLQEYPDPMHSI